MVADLGSPSRLCIQCKNKCENKIENDACVINKHRHCPVAELYRYEPRLEIVRGDIIAERLVTKLIDYRPCPPVILTGEQVNCLGDTKYNGLEQVPNSVYFEDKKTQEESTKKRKSKVRRSLETKNNVNSLNVPSSNEKMKEKDRNDKTNLKSIDTSSMEQITEIVNCIDSNIPPTKTKLIALSSPELKVSKKYSLDPSDMSLIYSLTPCINSENDHENIDKMMIDKSSKLSTFISEPNNNLEQDCFLQSNEEKSPKNEQQQWEKKDCVDDKTDNYIWFNSLSDSEKCELSNDNKTINNDVCFDNGQVEIRSNEGSDMLELFTDTTLELLETTGEYFRNDISNIANEIIAELNGNDTYVIIYCLVNEIFQKVYDTLSSIELNDRSSSPLSTISWQFSTPKLCLNVKDNKHTPKEIEKTQTNQTTPVIVIHEVIHHVIDACDEIKKAKTYANIELREKGNNDTVSNDEENIGQQKDLTTTVNSDKLKKASDRNTQVAPTVTAFENLVLHEKNDQSPETTAEADDMMEAAIFEFHTLVKAKPTNTDKKEFELNFRIERNFDVESSVEDKKSHRQNMEEVESGLSESLEKLAEIDWNINSDIENKKSHKKDKEKVELSLPESLEKLAEKGWNIDSDNLPEIDTREEEVAKLSETSKAVELKEKEDSNTSNNEKEEIGQRVDNLTTMINSDESKRSDRSMGVTSISFENLALDEENNQSVETEADAIFEFRTIVKAKPINTDKEAVELNFRIERSLDVESSVENKTSHRQNKEEVEPGLSESLEKLVEMDCNVGSYDLFEIEKRRKEPMTLSETTKAVEACVDCIYCMNSCPMDYNQEYSPLSTIGEEESDEKIVDLNAEIGGKRLDDTYTFCDSEKIVNDKELSSHNLENNNNAFL